MSGCDSGRESFGLIIYAPTTLFDVISGFVPPTEGTVELLGQDVTDASPERRALLGLGRASIHDLVPEDVIVPDNFTRTGKR